MSAAKALPGLRQRPARAAIYSLTAIASLCTVDAVVKWLAPRYSISEIVFLRTIASFALAVAVLAQGGGLAGLRTRRPLLHLLRSGFHLGSLLTFYYALTFLPLADTIALSFAAPLFMAVLSVPLLGERVGIHRWAALMIGFVGVVIMLRPTGRGFDVAGLLPVASALFYALAQISVRGLSATESSGTILFYNATIVLAVTGAAMPFEWQAPGWVDGMAFVLAGVLGAFGQLLINQAFRYGEVSMLAPLEYTGLIWAVVLGFAVWGDMPDLPMGLGALLVVLGGLAMARSEARRRRRVRGTP